MNTIRDKNGRIKKGQRISIATEFKKGQGFWTGKKRPEISGKKNHRWSGGKVSRYCLYCGKEFLVYSYNFKRGRGKSHLEIR